MPRISRSDPRTAGGYDHAGNFIDDGTLRYVYDAWNRLIKVQSAKDSGSVTFQTAEFDALGRRISKTVTNSGDFDGTFKYNYDGQRIVQVNNGSNAMVQQFIHGTQYIDELVLARVKDKGDLYVHQDANWNVVGLTDLCRHLVERYVLTPYGELMVNQETGYGDRDGDADVDSVDKGTVGTTCTGTVSGNCRILDLDFDGDYDATDATKFDALPQGTMHNPGLAASGVQQPFAHQGLLFEPEIGSYQNRARQYDPPKKRFAQADPLIVQTQAKSTQDGSDFYAYLAANPQSRLDPVGLYSEKVCDNSVWGNTQADCCEGYSAWGSPPLQRLAATECCGAALDANGTCAVVWCLNPSVLSLLNHDPGQVECLRVHEREHCDNLTCEGDSCPCTARSSNGQLNTDEECAGYCEEFKCLSKLPSGVSMSKRCNFVYCMAKETCSGVPNDTAQINCHTYNQTGCGAPPSACRR